MNRGVKFLNDSSQELFVMAYHRNQFRKISVKLKLPLLINLIDPVKVIL